MSRARGALLGLLIGAPFYLLLIDTTQSPELIAGAVAAVIAALAYEAAHRESTQNAAIRLRPLARGLGQLAQVPRGVAIVCLEVLSQTVAPRARRGVLEAEPFPAGGGDADDLGRRALAEALRSFAPHTIVIGVDPDRERLLLHRIGDRE